MPIGRLTVWCVVSSYLDDCALGLSPNTVESYRWNLDALIEFLSSLRVRSLLRVTADHLRAFFRHLQEQGYSPNTVHQHYRTVRAFFAWCIRQGYVSFSPVSVVRAPSRPRPVPVHLSASDVHKFIDAAKSTRNPERDYAIAMLFLDTGLRRAELVGLTVEDIDIPSRLVTVRLGKGAKGRKVPICSETSYGLAAWLVARPERVVGLFGLKPAGVRQFVNRIARRAGLGHVYPHALRHTFATLYGGDVQDLQKILGHSDVSTTASIYRHRDASALVAVHDERSPVAHLKELSQQLAAAGSVLGGGCLPGSEETMSDSDSIGFEYDLSTGGVASGAGAEGGAPDGGRLDEDSKSNSNSLPHRINGARLKAKRSINWLQNHATVDKSTGEISGSPLFDTSSGWFTRRQLNNKLTDLKRRISAYSPPAGSGCLFITFTIAGEEWEHGLSLDDAWGEISKRFNVWRSQFTRWAKQEFGVKPEYFCALEVQKKNGRNYPHYHVLVFGLPIGFCVQFGRGEMNWERKNRLFVRWWGLGFVDAVMVADRGQGVNVAGANYMLKYLYKQAAEIADDDYSLSSVPDWFMLPNVFKRRRYSFSRGFMLSSLERLPQWARRLAIDWLSAFGELRNVRRPAGGGWAFEFADTAVHVASPFAIVKT